VNKSRIMSTDEITTEKVLFANYMMSDEVQSIPKNEGNENKVTDADLYRWEEKKKANKNWSL